MKPVITLTIIGLVICTVSATANAPLVKPFRLLTDTDRELIERVVMSEARGECFEGMKAVAQVILHRLADKRWPDTVKEVLRSGQFARPWKGEVSRRVKQAVHEVFDCGLLIFETEVYFFLNPRLSSRTGAAWQYANTEKVAVVGAHEFRR